MTRPLVKRSGKPQCQLKVGKSPGIDGIPAEVYQHGGEAVLSKLQDLFTNCWEKGTLLQDLRDAVIVSLYRDKREKSDCSNYQGFTLLCTETREKNQTVQTTAASLCSPLQANPDDSTGKQARKPVWIQIQQRDRTHDPVSYTHLTLPTS